MKPQNLLLCLREPIIRTCSEPDGSSQRPHTVFLYDQL